MVARLRPNLSCGAWIPALENPLGRFQILWHIASTVESIETMAVGDKANKQRVCMILELALYRSKRHFMPGGRGIERNVLLMLERVSSVHLRCALGHSVAVRAV